MRNNLIYVHIEKVSHLTLTYGISNLDFFRGVKVKPKNLLSLGNVDPNQEIDIYSGFNMYLEEESVQKFLLPNSNQNIDWIDFDEVNDLESLTPHEVAELLYLGHAYTHLKSPFYYKLQNNYVYLTLPNGAKKVYYRYLPHFYQILATCITNKLASTYRERKPFLRSRHRFQLLDTSIIKEIDSLMVLGTVLDFAEIQIKGQELTVPFFLAPDSVYQLKWHEPTMLIEKSKLVGELKYYLNSTEWKLKILAPELLEDSLNF
ncbi:hypothetical protein [Liquorilactobacillus hordei]|uniref:hypothetical protein n=1 Tax=Liquorilactobacillus hordei TaxID=468911 RepID=UPI001CBB6CE1|nr:hypothetical protein [Liquorilactobacillus hordei]MBZ2406571.1 hypothetical protein [Liquorilactobacillus hordei]